MCFTCCISSYPGSRCRHYEPGYEASTCRGISFVLLQLTREICDSCPHVCVHEILQTIVSVKHFTASHKDSLWTYIYSYFSLLLFVSSLMQASPFTLARLRRRECNHNYRSLEKFRHFQMCSAGWCPKIKHLKYFLQRIILLKRRNIYSLNKIKGRSISRTTCTTVRVSRHVDPDLLQATGWPA